MPLAATAVGQPFLPGANRAAAIADLGPEDVVLIVSDNSGIADALAEAARARDCAGVEVLYLPEATRPVRAMGPAMAGAVAKASVVFNILTAYAARPALREDEVAFRAMVQNRSSTQRIYHMPGVTEEAFRGSGALGLDDQAFSEMEDLTRRTALALTLARRARVTSSTQPETDLVLDLGDLSTVAQVSTGRVNPGAWGNLPSGEAFILPADGNGTVVVDRAVSGLETIEPFRASLTGGQLTVEGSPDIPIKRMIAEEQAKAKDHEYSVVRLCEFGVGTNAHARPSSFLEIEKILGTVHIAVGSNLPFGGTFDAPNHTDMVVDRPTLALDDVEVMRDGQIDRDRLAAFATADRPAGSGPSFTTRDRVVRVTGVDAYEKGGRLYRRWTDARNNELEAPVGSLETAKSALAVWNSFPRRASLLPRILRLTARKRWIGQIVDEAQSGRLGGLHTDDGVLKTLHAMWLYGLVTFETPASDEIG